MTDTTTIERQQAEDEADSRVAADRLAEIEADPSSLVQMVAAKDIAGHDLQVRADDPKLVDGIVYPNVARAEEARRLAHEPAGDRKAVAGTKGKGGKRPAKAKAAKPAPKAKAERKPAAAKAPKAAKAAKADGPTKSDQVIAMLQRPEGATNQQIQDATGWLPHTTRAFLSAGLIKKLGHAAASEKIERDGAKVRVYRLSPPSSEAV